MANFLMDEFPAVVKQKDWVAPSVEVNNTDTEQLGNFLAQKIAASQPVKVEANPEYMQATPQVAMPVSGAEPAIAQTPIVPVEPTKNTLVAAQQQQQQPVPVTPAETLAPSEHSKYWGNKVFGKIPLDQFVQMAGMLANSFNPEDPLGKQLATMGGEAYKERIKQEYEGPNKLLEQKLKQEQLSNRAAGNELRDRLANFTENWPTEAERLKGLGYTPEAINRERQRSINNIVTGYSGIKGAQLEEKTIGREEGIDTRRAGQAITGRVADARIAKMGGDSARANERLNIAKKKADKSAGKAGEKPTDESEQFGKLQKIFVSPSGAPINVYQAKGKEARYRIQNADGTTRDATADEIKGMTGPGTPPKAKPKGRFSGKDKPTASAAPTAKPAVVADKTPAGAQTGKYKGVPAYTTDGGKTFFNRSTGERLK